MRIAEIVETKVHSIFEMETDKIPIFPPYLNGDIPLLIDITEKTEIEEGFIYNLETKDFEKPNLNLICTKIANPEPSINNMLLEAVTLLRRIEERLEHDSDI